MNMKRAVSKLAPSLRNSLIAALVAVISGVCLAPRPAFATPVDCVQLDASNPGQAHQRNGPDILFTVQQTGWRLQGTAAYSGHTGSVEGAASGKAVKLTVHWDSGAIGQYDGALVQYYNSRPSDPIVEFGIVQMEGTAVDGNRPGAGPQDTWISHEAFKCLEY